ncbi:ribosome-associated ATPase/putative transporter RbbA [Neptunomonas antarctica]|uniref:Ribosome-dependent ATPase n=1 Tax=Neptunomonas antarctica TaxID=619304 RepID=A0A1N7M8I9_9GAMM|nr:ribosome-associated ATPase/putative transporter RbbA [Neptunomonas antarctica]SIS82408.1 ribosome-dependent ATPase [Neptunomonas antarctica]
MVNSGKCVAVLSGVSHQYGETYALKQVDLEIPSGCMVGLIGPDGVGKSTLLALVAGARQIQEGAIRVFDGDISAAHYRNEIAPRIAFMPQGLGKNLYATLSVFENIDFFGRLFGLPSKQRHQQIDELLSATGLAAFRDRPAGKLSGGMKQKLGLCCALIHAPDLLILDEPTTGVDPLSRRQFWELIGHIRQRRAGMSVIVATAYMDEAELFDWIIPMNMGKVLDTGSVADIKQRTNTDNLESAFINLLPESTRNEHQVLSIPPLNIKDKKIAITARGLTKKFGDFTAVDNINLEITQGEIFGFLGSNGCGKSTTMKMLTGLLPVSSGEGLLFDRAVDPNSMAIRHRVGYMSQGFSLYGELTVLQNLELHAKLFHMPADYAKERISSLLDRFALSAYQDVNSMELPLGIRQRLSLAVAVVHEPELLILDEPTSGVDPVARDSFWALLIDLSRNHGVTIFISTHFMNEAERCDRISLMHAGKILVTDTPDAISKTRHAKTLEDAFIAYLEEAQGGKEETPPEQKLVDNAYPIPVNHAFSLRRLFGFSYREALEVLRDPIRLAFALLGSAILMLVLGYGISLDVDDLTFAVLDQDQTPQSRNYIQNISASRYFIERAAIGTTDELDQRMRNGELSFSVVIPPGFGVDLKRGRVPEIAVWVDGAMPFRAETIGGYMQGMHTAYLTDLTLKSLGYVPTVLPVSMASRYRFNQDFKSIYALAPSVIPLLLMFIPAILTALSVVREKEMGSIVNLYVSPATRLEFLLGKQLPYILISMVSFVILLFVTVYIFQVPIKGDLYALYLAAFIYIIATTGIGLFMSTFTQTQIAALAGTAIVTLLVTVSFSGLTSPVSSLEGVGRLMGESWPATYFIIIIRGIVTKGLGFTELVSHFQHLLAFAPLFTLVSVMLLRKQGK